MGLSKTQVWNHRFELIYLYKSFKRVQPRSHAEEFIMYTYKLSHPIVIIIFLCLVLVAGCATAALSNQNPRDLPTISQKTQGMERQEGFFSFYYESHTGNLYLEIERPGEEFLYLNSLVTGIGTNEMWGFDRGTIGREAVVRFERFGPNVLLIQDNTTFRALDTGNVHKLRSVEESFPTSVIGSFPVVAGTGDKLLVDGTEFFLKDMYDIANRLHRAGHGNFSVDRDRSAIYHERTKAFPKNTEVQVMHTFAADNPSALISRHTPDGRSLTLRQQHSFVELPDPGFTPRNFDPRVGFFHINYMDFNRPFPEEYERRLIARWRLEKKDPDAGISEPVKPITFYMDPGIPEPYYSAFKEGILWWNKPFEAAGFQNAVVVEDLPDDADPMDARYSVIQWVHRSGPGPSVGPSLKDPRTGEIIKTIVRMDSHRSLVNYSMYRGYIPAAESIHQCGLSEPGFDAWITQYISAGNVNAEEFAMARRRQHAAHEVGHTLGLAHNFIAASYGRASVMDYPAPLLRLQDDGSIDVSDAYRDGPGSYDSLAIMYGYTQFDSAEEEEQRLHDIVQRGIERGNRFITGDDAGTAGSIPQAAVWVNGENMIDELERIMMVRQTLLNNFDLSSIDPGQPVWLLQEPFTQVYLYHMFTLMAATKTIGGMDWTYARAGDGQTITEIISPDEQRRALSLILKNLDPDALRLPDHVTGMLAPAPYGYAAEEGIFSSPAGPAFDPISVARSVAQSVVNGILQRDRAARLIAFHAQNAELPSLDEVITKLIDATWGVETLRNPMDAALQRVGQRAVLDGILHLAADGNATVDVRAAAELKLTDLYGMISDRTGRTGESEAHYNLARGDIRRYLDRTAIPVDIMKPVSAPPVTPWLD
jgi:hypothetical protein